MEVTDGERYIQRFPSRAAAALLARLALAPDRVHAREELVELLWPGVDLAVGRNRLRQTLSTLKSLLEPSPRTGAAVLQADRLGVRALLGTLDCDVQRFEVLVRAGRSADAVALYRGEFMPGHYDEWVHEERRRLAHLVEEQRERLHRASAATPGPLPAPPLPAYLTRLFGAQLAAARLRERVCSQRLVTLFGPGGSGKTRLAVEVARGLRQTPIWPGATPGFERIVFVSLVCCEDSAQMRQAVASALGLPAGGADDPRQLIDALAGQRVLMVLDNFEQLVGLGEVLLAQLLAGLPQLHLLLTSRRALGLDGEVSLPAEALPVPDIHVTTEDAAANPAVALFLDRARAVQADFRLLDDNCSAVVGLMRALRGMPLAIELAASRVRSLPPAEMLSLLCAADTRGAHLSLLARSGPRAGHDPRHASMAQVIAWSWRLLEPASQRLLGALSLFSGDASADAVAMVLGEDRAQVAAGLDDLLQQSMLYTTTPSEGAETARFALLEPVREFVVAQLDAKQVLALQAGLRRWCLVWAQSLGMAPPLARVTPELRTVRAVLTHACKDGAPEDALRLLLALRAYWETDPLPGTVLDALEAALRSVEAAAGLSAGLACEAHELLAYLRFEAGFSALAATHADAALAAAGTGSEHRARALVRCVWVELGTGRADADAGPGLPRLRAQLDEALRLAYGAGDHEIEARALHQQAVIASRFQGDWPAAEALLAHSQALWQSLGDRHKARARLRNRAQCWVRMGRTAQARASFEWCEHAARADGDWVGQIDSLLSLSTLLQHQRDWSAALAADRACITLCWQRWHRHGLGYALWNPPRSLARLRRPEPALRLMAFAAGFWESSFGPLSRHDLQQVRRVRALVQLQIGRERTQSLWLEGAAMNVSQAVALALQDCRVAGVGA